MIWVFYIPAIVLPLCAVVIWAVIRYQKSRIGTEKFNEAQRLAFEKGNCETIEDFYLIQYRNYSRNSRLWKFSLILITISLCVYLFVSMPFIIEHGTSEAWRIMLAVINAECLVIFWFIYYVFSSYQTSAKRYLEERYSLDFEKLPSAASKKKKLAFSTVLGSIPILIGLIGTVICVVVAVYMLTMFIIYPPNPKAIRYYDAGRECFDIRQFDEAIENFSEVIKIDPDCKEAYYSRALCYGEKEQYDNVMDDINKAIDLDPEYADAYVVRAYTYCRLDQTEDAIADYKKALQLDPENSLAEEALRELGVPVY